jgi:hypothetical protein
LGRVIEAASGRILSFPSGKRISLSGGFDHFS